MPLRTPHYHAQENTAAAAHADAYTRPAFSLANRLRRLLWTTAWLLLCRWTPRPLHAWRATVLRLFGATLGADCHIYPRARIWAPWNLQAQDHLAVADGVVIYNPAPFTLGSHVILSQDCYLCGATHDYNDPAFPLLAFAMRIESYAWICARATVGPGANVGEGAVLGLGAVTTRDLDPWSVYTGNPATKVRDRHKVTAGTV